MNMVDLSGRTKLISLLERWQSLALDFALRRCGALAFAALGHGAQFLAHNGLCNREVWTNKEVKPAGSSGKLRRQQQGDDCRQQPDGRESAVVNEVELGF